MERADDSIKQCTSFTRYSSVILSRQICSELFRLFARHLSSVIFEERHRFSDEMRSLTGWLWDIWLFQGSSTCCRMNFLPGFASDTLYFSLLSIPSILAQYLLMKKSHPTWCFNTGMVFLTCGHINLGLKAQDFTRITDLFGTDSRLSVTWCFSEQWLLLPSFHTRQW